MNGDGADSLLIQRHRALVVAALGVQIAFLVVFSDQFFLESGLIGGNDGLYDFLRGKLAMYDLPPDFYSRQFLNAAYDDSSDYMVAIAGEDATPPFKFRVAYIWLVAGLTSIISGCDTLRSPCGFDAVAYTAKLLNLIFIILTFAVIRNAAQPAQRDTPLVIAIAASGALSFGAFLTSAFVMADALLGLVFALAAFFFASRRLFALTATICVGVLVKEIAIVLGLLIAWEFLRQRRAPAPVILGLCALPLATFVGVRVALGEDPLSLNYGWDVSEGYFEIRYVILHSKAYFIPFLTKTAFGIGLIGLFFVTTLRHRRRAAPELFAFAAVCAAVIIANLLLASGVIRIASVLAPMLSVALVHYGLVVSARTGELLSSMRR